MKFKKMLPVAAMALIVGCSSATHEKTGKQLVTEQWNRTRASVLLGLAKDQYAAGNFEPARHTVDDTLRMDPENAPLHVLSAKLAIEAGQLDLASKDLEKARKTNPKD